MMFATKRARVRKELGLVVFCQRSATETNATKHFLAIAFIIPYSATDLVTGLGPYGIALGLRGQ